MPIKPENRSRYPANWAEISERIRFERAQGRCECRGECGHEHVHVAEDWIGTWTNNRCKAIYDLPHPVTGSRVVLTVAHLDHTPENSADGNLRAMCQRCHLAYDQEEHQRSREETRKINMAGRTRRTTVTEAPDETVAEAHGADRCMGTRSRRSLSTRSQTSTCSWPRAPPTPKAGALTKTNFSVTSTPTTTPMAPRARNWTCASPPPPRYSTPPPPYSTPPPTYSTPPPMMTTRTMTCSTTLLKPRTIHIALRAGGRPPAQAQQGADRAGACRSSPGRGAEARGQGTGQGQRPDRNLRGAAGEGGRTAPRGPARRADVRGRRQGVRRGRESSSNMSDWLDRAVETCNWGRSPPMAEPDKQKEGAAPELPPRLAPLSIGGHRYLTVKDVVSAFQTG